MALYPCLDILTEMKSRARVVRLDSDPPADGVHDEVTAVGDATEVLAAIRASTSTDTKETAKVTPFDLAQALRKTREEPERKESGTRLIAVRPEETQYARAPAESIEIVSAAPVPIASIAPRPAPKRPNIAWAVVDVVLFGLLVGIAAAVAMLR